MSSHTALSAASEDRKARLAKLKSLKRKQPTDEVVAPEANERLPATSSHKEIEDADGEAAPPDVTHLHLSGRNYDPETRGPKLGFEAPPTLPDDKATLEQQAADLEAQVKQQAATEAAEQKGIDLFKLQPKKPNWDLKRNLEQKMDVLNVRTDNAIARLVKDRITAAQKAAQKSSGGEDVEAAGMDGATLVESLRARCLVDGDLYFHDSHARHFCLLCHHVHVVTEICDDARRLCACDLSLWQKLVAYPRAVLWYDVATDFSKIASYVETLLLPQPPPRFQSRIGLLDAWAAMPSQRVSWWTQLKQSRQRAT
ncbi:hypothetical protein MY4824_006732 [Beauveria thailandica]